MRSVRRSVSRRRLVAICPANLRKQWSQELADKFYLPSVILETRTFNEAVKRGNLNPFQQDAVSICSFQFARSKEAYVRQSGWEVVVIDEAHRLRNASTSRATKWLRLSNRPSELFQKVLLTATPLQNSLLELFGLVSIIDEYTFGDLKSFRDQFTRLASGGGFELRWKRLLKPICQRTLRNQVLEYVPYTTRHAIVQEFVPSVDEQRLYDLVSDYLQRPTLYALPASQRQLMTLILRKLLASSTYAISNTLQGLANKLQAARDASEQVQTPTDQISDNFELLPEIEDEWAEDDEDSEETQGPAPVQLTPQQLEEMKEEMETLREFHTLARSIQKNSKGEVLLTALRKGFAAAVDAQKGQSEEPPSGAALQQKALIFTESRRTQEYLFQILEQTQFAG